MICSSYSRPLYAKTALHSPAFLWKNQSYSEHQRKSMCGYITIEGVGELDVCQLHHLFAVLLRRDHVRYSVLFVSCPPFRRSKIIDTGAQSDDHRSPQRAASPPENRSGAPVYASS